MKNKFKSRSKYTTKIYKIEHYKDKQFFKKPNTIEKPVSKSGKAKKKGHKLY